MRSGHNRIQPLLQYGCVALRMRFFSQNFGTIKRILPGSSSPSHREGPGTEVGELHQYYNIQKYTLIYIYKICVKIIKLVKIVKKSSKIALSYIYQLQKLLDYSYIVLFCI